MKHQRQNCNAYPTTASILYIEADSCFARIAVEIFFNDALEFIINTFYLFFYYILHLHESRHIHQHASWR